MASGYRSRDSEQELSGLRLGCAAYPCCSTEKLSNLNTGLEDDKNLREDHAYKWMTANVEYGSNADVALK